jgi:hypothetical protein
MPRLLASLALVALFVACKGEVRVGVNPARFEKLALAGDQNVEGTVTRALTWRDASIPLGARVRVNETWLARKDKKSPPGYRVAGLYDPSARSDGLMLPRNSVEVFYVASLLPEAGVTIPVPKSYFERAP